MSVSLANQIDLMLSKSDGWCPPDKAHTLAAIVLALRPAFSLEIGIYGGRSFLSMALALRHIGHGLLIGCDPWSRQASIEGMDDQANRNWWGNLDHDRIYHRFMERVVEFDVRPFIDIRRCKSDDLVLPETPKLDLAHVDGSHEETAYRDITRFGAMVRSGGIIVLDDTQWSSGAPQRGVQWLLGNGFIQLYPLGTGAVFQRVSPC